MLGLSGTVVGLFAALVLLGGLVQSTVGLGVGLVFSPVLALVDPGLVPTLPLCMSVLTPVTTLLWEHRGIDWSVVRWALGARLLGTAAGVWVVVHVSTTVIAAGLGAMVLIAVAASLVSVRIPDNRTTRSAAGLVAGVTGTATSISGPPIALVLQHRDPARLRPTLAVFFGAVAVASLVGLAAGGGVDLRTLELAGVLAPFVVLGVWGGTRLRVRAARARLRLGLLGVCACTATALLVRTLA